MTQEDHTQKCSNSGSGGGGGGGCDGGDGGGDSRSSKRLKQKKVPQRGLGVAQLEKIRLEEQQKKDASLYAQQAASILSHNAIISPSDSSSSSCLAAAQCHNFRPRVSSSSIQFSSPNDLPSSNSLLRPSPSMPDISLLHTNQVTLSKALNVVGGDGGVVGCSAMPYPRPKFWDGSYILEGENQKLDHHGLSIRSNVHLPYESNTSVLPLPTTLMQRSQQFQQLPSASKMNISSGISASSSVVNFQMEPPSNQSYRGNNYSPLWPEEEKMVGLKRQYPFSLEIPPAPPFHGKFPSTLVDPFARSDESTSCSNGSPANIEKSSSLMREGPSSLHVPPEPNPRNVIQENGNLDGDFLTLAPPAACSPYINSRHKHPLANSGPSTQELSLSSQDHSEDHMQRPGASGSNGQPFFCFLPSANVQIGQAANCTRNCNSKVGESVDLNLKL